MAKRKQAGHVAEICLYGNGSAGVGCGYLAQTADGRHFGDGEPRRHRTFTDCVFLAAEEFKAAGLRSGLCRVYAAGGFRMSHFELSGLPPYFGDLTWEPAPVLTISAADLDAAAGK